MKKKGVNASLHLQVSYGYVFKTVHFMTVLFSKLTANENWEIWKTH
jgi:hypothetical protein